LEAAEALGTVAVRPQVEVFELLSRLVAKSMVLAEESRENKTSVVRYRFLETIRQYAEEKLVEADEAEMVRTHHRDWYLGLAEQGLQGMEAADQRLWWDRLELEHDNLNAALTWSAADPNGSQGLLRLAGLLGRFWEARGHGSEGIGWLEMALAQSDTTPSSVRARALNWLGQLESRNGNIERATPSLEESVLQARTVRDQRVLSMALRHLSVAVRGMGNQARALLLIEEAVAVSRAEGYQREIAWNLGVLGSSLAFAGLLDAVEPVLLESIAVGRASGDITPVLASTGALARLYLMLGDLPRARRTVEETLALSGQTDVKLPIAELLVVLGDVASAERDWESADNWYRRALSVASVLAARGMIAHALRQYAAMCAARGNPHGAARILGATSPVRHFPGSVMMNLKVAQDDIVAATRQTLGEDAFEVAWAKGESITLEQATAEILSEDNDKFSHQ
jgi:tetratricopeptide (TPR) repeat protein